MRLSLFSFVVLTAACNADVTSVEGADQAALERINLTFLTAEMAYNTPSTDIVLGGVSNWHVATFRLATTGEDLVLENLNLRIVGATRTIAEVQIGYVDETGAFTMATGTITGRNVSFVGQDMPVPAAGADLLAYVTATTTATPGDAFRLDWVDNGVQATGVDTGHVYGAPRTTNRAASFPMAWHASRPAFTLSASSPSGVQVPDFNTDALHFNATAATQGEDVGVDAFTFLISSTDNDLTGWNQCDTFAAGLYDLSQNPLQPLNGTWVYSSVNGSCQSGETVAYATFYLIDRIVIDSSTTVTYAFHADTTNVSSSANDVLRVDLVDLEWLDRGVPFDGALVNNLPVSGHTLVF